MFLFYQLKRGRNFSDIYIFLGTNTLFSPHPESLVFWGFQGGPTRVPWAFLLSSQGEESVGTQERYIPLGLEAYGCSQAGRSPRRDMELLRAATGPP